jgi:hypothetical protein
VERKKEVVQQVRAWFASSSAMEQTYRVEEQFMYTVTFDGKTWHCDCRKKKCRHILSAQGAAGLAIGSR